MKGVGNLGEKVKRLRKEEKKNPNRRRPQYGDYQRESRVGEVEDDKGQINGDGRGLTWGGEHTMQYRDDIL